MIVIYRPNGTPVFGTDTDNNPVALAVDDDSGRTAELMGDDILTLRFSLAENVTIPLRSWCVFEGKRYYLYKSPEITKQNERNFGYVMPMYTSDYLLKITLMRNRTYNSSTGEYGGDLRLKFPLTATPREHLEMVAACLNDAETEQNAVWAVDYSKTVGMVSASNGAHTNFDGTKWNDEGDAFLVSYEFNYCVDAIRNAATSIDTEYEIADAVVTSGGTTKVYHLLSLHNVEYNKDTPLYMSYGKGNGFEKGIVRRVESDLPPVDRLYIQGGEQNIPTHYGMKATTVDGTTTYSEESPNYIKSNTLLLPKNVACFVSGGKYYFSLNPTIRTDSDGNRYIQQKDYRDADTNLPVYEVLYDGDGNPLGTMQLLLGTPCFLTSADGRSVERVRHTYYDPDYTPRGTKVESFYDASEVYPMRVGGVSLVKTITRTREVDNGDGTTSTETYKLYDIVDALAQCPDYSQCSIDGETMTVIFQDGMLAGREFELNTTESGTVICTTGTYYDDDNNPVSGKKLELCPSDQDGFTMPNDTFRPRVGDHYIAFHCSLPEEYIGGIAYGAEFRALREMSRYLYDHGKETFTFSGTVYKLWAKKVWDDYVERYNTESYGYKQIKHGEYFALGQHIKVTDVQLFGASGLVLRVTGIKQPVNSPRAIELTLTNAIVLKYNWAKQLAQTVEEVRVRPRYRRPDNPIFPWHRGAREILELDALDAQGNLLDLRRVPVVPYSIYKPFTQYVGNLDLAEQQDRTKVNEVIDSLLQTNTYFLQCRNAVQALREAIADSASWDNLKTKIYRNSKTGYIVGVPEIGSGGVCTPESCSQSVVDIEVPNKLSLL